jgi:membrane carboxypeptidase/penicillin-binding protein
LNKLDQLMGISDGNETGETESLSQLQGALVAVECNSGAVKALVGGRDYSQSEFNRAVENNRQPGSGFKPFLYYAAFEKLGFNPASVFVDKPYRIAVAGARDWQPKNFEREHEGPMILQQALVKSINAIAAQLVERTGPEAVIDAAKRCGIKSPLSPVYSVALGTSGVSPLEMASAFSTFATGGVQHEPFWIRRVEDPLGRVLEEHIVRGRRSLDPAISYQVVDMMRGVLSTGTGRVVRQMGFDLPAAGKTGTSDDFRDSWFTGFTPTLSVSVWVGFDRGVRMRDTNGVGITGGRGAAPIWTDFMIKATDGEPAREFVVPPDIHFESVDPLNGEIAAKWTRNAVQVALRSSQMVAAATGHPSTNEADLPALQDQDQASTAKSKPSVFEKAQQFGTIKTEKPAITEEDLPPD